MNYIGELAALLTSLLWSTSSIFFTKAGQLVGSVIVNRVRLLVAFLLILTTHILLDLPFNEVVFPYHWFWLGLSGLFGIALGDALLFQAYLMIGPRLSLLLMGLAPIFTALAGWIFLNEKLFAIEICGILLTIGGVAWVIFEKKANFNTKKDKRIYYIGLLLAFGSAITSATGYIASKVGLQGNFPPLTATLIRVSSATIAIWLITFLTGHIKLTVDQLKKNPLSLRNIILGAFVGPFLGITASMLAIQKAPVGVASTLMSLSPIFLLPIGYFIFKEEINLQSIIGTIIAISGVAILFLV